MTANLMKRVLLVDDDEDIRDTIADILEGGGYSVSQATNGQDALDVLARIERPCLILLDVKMPVLDGHEFLGNLPRELRDIPVVLMTASRSVPSGWPVLAKPFDLEELNAHVALHCGDGRNSACA
jgi:CheY-like chemotaxis protein